MNSSSLFLGGLVAGRKNGDRWPVLPFNKSRENKFLHSPFTFFYFYFEIIFNLKLAKIVERSFAQLPVVLTSYLTMMQLSKPGNEHWLNNIH